MSLLDLNIVILQVETVGFPLSSEKAALLICTASKETIGKADWFY
jgi:hypothetical protein